MVLHYISLTFVDIFGVWTPFRKIFGRYHKMVSFQEKYKKNGDQKAKKLTLSLIRRKYEIDKPKTDNIITGLFI